MKYDKDKVEARLNQEYFAHKVDLIPVSLKETFSDLGKNPVLVSRELIVEGRPLLGIEYAPNGKDVVNVYTTDTKGRRVNFENADEQKPSAAPDLISERLNTLRQTMSHDILAHETAHAKNELPEKKVVTPRKLDPKVAATKLQKGPRQ